MAVTQSIFPNMNTFSHGPEFCVLYRKLRSTCQSHKRDTLVARYTTICSEIESKPKEYCPKNFTRDFAKIPLYTYCRCKLIFMIFFIPSLRFLFIRWRFETKRLSRINKNH